MATVSCGNIVKEGWGCVVREGVLWDGTYEISGGILLVIKVCLLPAHISDDSPLLLRTLISAPFANNDLTTIRCPS